MIYIQTENHKIEVKEDILINYVRWLCSSKWVAESVMIKFINAEHINLTFQTELIWNSEYKKTELYNWACCIQKCFKYYKYDYISAQCESTQKCSICAESHRSENCFFKNLEFNIRKCVNCEDLYKIWNNKCSEF